MNLSFYIHINPIVNYRFSLYSLSGIIDHWIDSTIVFTSRKRKEEKLYSLASVFKDAGSTIIISTVLTSIYFINIIDVLNRLYVCMYVL